MIDREELKRVMTTRLEQMKEKNPNFSLRAFAKRLGVSPAEISQFLGDRRKISEQMAEKIVEALELSYDEVQEVVKKGQGVLKGQSILKPVVLSIEDYEQVSQWYYFAILSISLTVDFQSDPKWIAQRLNITTSSVVEAIDKMLSLGMMERRGDGTLVSTQKSFATPEGKPGDLLRNAHKMNFKLATECLDYGRVEDRDFRAATLCIDPSRLPEARKVLQEFHNRFVSFMDEGEKSEVYKFCMQLFPITCKMPTSAPPRV